jgi:UDP-N-acetylglucosamine 1-carboxyvinyltransferase
MDKILVHGGHPLSGSIKISGSKNSALPIIAATLLTREPSVLHRVPDLSDTNYMLQILMHLGGEGGINRTLRNRAQDARFRLPARAIVRPVQGSDCFAARRLRHRRSAD